VWTESVNFLLDRTTSGVARSPQAAGLATGSIGAWVRWPTVDGYEATPYCADRRSSRTWIFVAEPARREPSFKHRAPDYVRFERPPVVEPLQLAHRRRDQPL